MTGGGGRPAPVSRVEVRRRADEVFADLRGRVLEVGAGEGENLDAFRSDVSWTGIEPDEGSRRQLEIEARKYGFVDQVLDARCEELPFADESFDAVIATLVFCSVTDLDASLAEVMRVLKPGGTLACVEHVHAPRDGPARDPEHGDTALRDGGTATATGTVTRSARHAGRLPRGEARSVRARHGVPFLPAPCVVYVGVKPNG